MAFCFFFRITHRLCVQGNEWVVAFGAALPLLQTVEQNWFRDFSTDENTKKNIKLYFIVERQPK